MLYAAIKTGFSVKLEDMGLNVLIDLLNYSAEIDGAAIEGINGKNIRKSAPMGIAEMTAKRKMRG